MTGVICGTGACVPDRILDNNEIAQFVDTSDQWIQERTGVIRRRIAQTETTASMAAEAGRQALEEAGIRPEEIDMILAATATPDHIFPCAACEIQERLQAVKRGVFRSERGVQRFPFCLSDSAGIHRVGNVPDHSCGGKRKSFKNCQLGGPGNLYSFRRRFRSGCSESKRGKELDPRGPFRREGRTGAFVPGSECLRGTAGIFRAAIPQKTAGWKERALPWMARRYSSLR